MDISRDRGMLPSKASGLGAHFTSPTKLRNPKRKTQTMTSSVLDSQAKKRRLHEELARLLKQPQDSEDWEDVDMSANRDKEQVEEMNVDGVQENFSIFAQDLPKPPGSHFSSHEAAGSDSPSSSKRLTPDRAALNLCASWQALMPTLVDDFLAYYGKSVGHHIQPIPPVYSEGCPTGACMEYKSTNILCLYFDRMWSITIPRCIFMTGSAQISSPRQ